MGGTLGLKAWFDPTSIVKIHKAKQTLLVRLLYQVATSRATYIFKVCNCQIISLDHLSKV